MHWTFHHELAKLWVGRNTWNKVKTTYVVGPHLCCKSMLREAPKMDRQWPEGRRLDSNCDVKNQKLNAFQLDSVELLSQWTLQKINLMIDCKHFNRRVGALVKWLWEETHVPKVVGSSPVTVFWIDIFSHIFVAKIVMMFVWKDRK